MPVSLGEWRVRIGTFVHWIRDYEIKERKERLLKERIRRMKVLCERLKAKGGDSEEDSKEDGENVGKTRHDISNPRKSNQCPHKTTNIESPGDSSYIKDLLTSCDQCLHDLLTQNHSHIEKILTQSDTSTEQLLAQNDSCLKDLLLAPNCSRNHQHAECGASFEELTQSNSRIKKLLTQSDLCIKELLYSVDSRKDDTLLSTESCRNTQPVESNSTASDLFSQTDSDSRILLVPSNTNTELQAQSDSYVQDPLKPRDTSINELLTVRDSSVKDVLTSRDFFTELPMPSHSSVKGSLTPKDCSTNELLTPHDSLANVTHEGLLISDLLTLRDSQVNELLIQDGFLNNEQSMPRDSNVNELLTPRDSSTNELPTPRHYSVKGSLTPRDCSINELLAESNAFITELLTKEGSLIKELLTPKDPAVYNVLTPKDSPRNELSRSRYSSIAASLTPRDCLINELLAASDFSITELLTKEDSLIEELLTPKDPAVYEVLRPRELSLGELPIPKYSSIKESLMPNSSLSELLKPADVSMNELQKPADSSVSELLTPRYNPVDGSLTPGDSKVRKLLTPKEQVLEVHEHQKGFRNEGMGYEKLKKLESSQASAKGQLIGLGSKSPVEGTKHDESARHQTRHLNALSTSTSDCNAAQKELQKPKEISNESSNSSSICTQSVDASADGIYNPCVAELLLAKSGDVELNPGPLHRSIDGVLEDSELVLLAKDVPGNCYTELCIDLGFSYTESQNVLTKHLMDIPGALIEFLCRWKVKQRDGTDCRAILAGILGNTNMGALQKKLLAGGYLRTETSPSAPDEPQPPDTPQPLIDMTEEQVAQCAEDLETFYREQMCKIKTDPLDFTSVLEFERIYTNLTLLKSKTPLEYTALLTTKVNGMIPKRLMVEGEGGVGKTTFCSKIAWDWANGSPQFNQFSWVLVIPLRNVIKGQTVGDIVKNYLSDSNSVSPAQIDNYILSQPTKVLIVLDGLDEYDGDLSSEEGYDISQILRRKKFKECTVLVTTRPWKADQIKCNGDLSRTYAFIAVKGFSSRNVSSYIKKYFADDEKAGSDLIRFIEVNDIIRGNMAPFPIYVAMLCILWKTSDDDRREAIRKLKTFSQLFDQMVMFLKDHYASKITELLQEADLEEEMENINSCLLEIGSIAFQGLLAKKLTFIEKDFISCKKAMETCCRVGVLSRENQNISRWKKTLKTQSSVTTTIFFPHKLFQEYIAALHLDSLYDTDRVEYSRSLGKVVSGDAQEFRYLLYFTASRGKEIGLDIVNKIQQIVLPNDYYPYQNEPSVWNLQGDYAGYTYTPTVSYPFPGWGYKGRRRKGHNDFLVDVTFEAYNEDTAKSVGRRIFAEEKMLTIDEDMPAHTMSGYLFIMEQHGMETLIFQGRTCGPTVSRDLADVLCSSSSLSRLEFYGTTLNEDFYRLMQDQTSSAGVISVKELYVDHQFLGDLHRFDVTVGDLFPGLQHLRLTSPQTVRPGFVERLTHPNLSVLSIESVRYDDSNRSLKDGEEWPVPFIGEPASLGQLFSSSFPHLSSLTVRDLVIGNVRCEAILHSLRNHKHIKSISFTSCFTDDSLDCLASEMSKENGITVSLQHNYAQQQLDFGGDSESRLTPDLMDALCHGTCVRTLVVHYGGMVRSMEWFPELQGREVHSKIQTFTVKRLELHDDQSASCYLGKFISLLPCLTDLTIRECSFHDEFFKEIADRASSSKIQTFKVTLLELRDDQSASCGLRKFICLLPCLTDLRIELSSFHDEFYKEIADHASSSKIQTFMVKYLKLHDDQSASCCLGRFICLLPCLTDLTIELCSFHDKFYKEIADRASSSKIKTFTVVSLKLHDDHSASCCIGRFICLLPCLTDLTIDACSFHYEFYKEIADRASSSKIQTLTVKSMQLHNDQSASYSLGKFICLLPCLTDLTIRKCSFHDEFYKEIADHASSSKIQTFTAESMELNDDQSASWCLGMFICLLPCLTDMTIWACFFHDRFYKEIADRASSSKIQTFTVKSMKLRGDQSASCLGKFICLLPCLTDMTIWACFIHDRFYKEIAERASSSKIQTFTVKCMDLYDDQSASCCLGKFICLLPCLTDLTIRSCSFHDKFYKEIADYASSSKNPYFRNKKHMGMLQKWSAGKVGRQQQQLNQRHHAMNPAYQHSLRSREQLGPNILQPRQSAQPSVQYQNDHQRPIHSEHQQVHQLRNPTEIGSFQQQLGSCSSHPWQLPQPGLHYQNDLQRGRQAEPQQVPWIAPDNQHQSRSLDRLEQQGPYLLQPQRPAQLSTHYRDNQQRNMYLHPTQSHVIINPAHYQSGSVEHIWPSYHLRLAQPPMQYQDIDQRDIQSQFPQIYQLTNSTQQHHLRLVEQQRTYYLPQSQYPVQLSVPYHDSHQRHIHSFTSRGADYSVGMTPIHVHDGDRDRPSTSGLKSADIYRSASVGSEGSSVRVGKRSHSDSDSDDGTVSTSESKQRQSGKRRTKTDRDPDSP